jgi:hypothetical protein
VNPLYKKIKAIDLKQAFAPKVIKDIDFANACLAAVWLHHDFLDESHTLSQEIPSSTGSFWHGMMHRREGDYWNSKYWFKRVLDHAIFSRLHHSATQIIKAGAEAHAFENILGQSFWNPFQFVDLVERFIDTKSDQEIICQKIQRIEWQLLFHYSFRKALGTSDERLFI